MKEKPARGQPPPAGGAARRDVGEALAGPGPGSAAAVPSGSTARCGGRCGLAPATLRTQRFRSLAGVFIPWQTLLLSSDGVTASAKLGVPVIDVVMSHSEVCKWWKGTGFARSGLLLVQVLVPLAYASLAACRDGL